MSVGPNEDEAHYACLSALFLTNPRDDRETLITTKGPGVDGTCQWIKSHALYDSWLRSHSQLLWLSGGPGKGNRLVKNPRAFAYVLFLPLLLFTATLPPTN